MNEVKEYQGTCQFLSSKKALLGKYDVAKKQAETHAVQTFHGTVAEAAFREWLSSFLPKRYGVTSGYIASQSIAAKGDSLRHFDVIIYDALNCPILSIEECGDYARKGQSLVIPAEYVQAVMEVKANLTVDSIGKANKKLEELNHLLFDFPKDANNPYSGKLHPQFFTCNVFFELRAENEHKQDIFQKLHDPELPRHFANLILRAESLSEDATGVTQSLISDTCMPLFFNSLVGSPMHATHFREGKYLGLSLFWHKMNFSRFAFDVLALLNGTYTPGRVSSFYGMSFD